MKTGCLIELPYCPQMGDVSLNPHWSLLIPQLIWIICFLFIISGHITISVLIWWVMSCYRNMDPTTEKLRVYSDIICCKECINWQKCHNILKKNWDSGDQLMNISKQIEFVMCFKWKSIKIELETLHNY